MTLPRSHWPEGVIIILALLVRLIHLNGSFWLDEAAQALESNRPLSQQLDIAADFQPPLFHLLVHGLIQLNQAEWWLRLASLIPGLVTVWLTILIGKRLYSREVGLTAGVLLATSQYHIFYSQELRPYSLAACLGLIAFWGWLNLIQSRRRFSPTFFLASLAGIYTSYLFPVLLLSLLFMTFIYYRPRFLLLTSYFVLLAIGFLPWLPSFWQQIGIGTDLAAQSSLWANIVSPPLAKMIPLVYIKFIFGRIPFDPTLFTLFITAAVGISLLAVFDRVRRNLEGRLLIGLVLLPTLFGFLISLAVPVLDPKRVLFSLPFLYLTIAAGLGRRLKSGLILALLLTVNMSAIRLYTSNPDMQREPWREAVGRLEAEAPDNTLVTFAFTAPFAPYEWYQQRHLPSLSITDPASFPAVDNPYVVTFDYLAPLYDPSSLIQTALTAQDYQETGFYQYPGIGKIRVYAR